MSVSYNCQFADHIELIAQGLRISITKIFIFISHQKKLYANNLSVIQSTVQELFAKKHWSRGALHNDVLRCYALSLQRGLHDSLEQGRIRSDIIELVQLLRTNRVVVRIHVFFPRPDVDAEKKEPDPRPIPVCCENFPFTYFMIIFIKKLLPF